ncbi:MAG: heparinase II/III family protein [Wenyingzhuangia sp.]|uniref:heparinase II/III domain-containing protein n=1 Tax=Wenyingzhuangia sp. TaxID=1964193 RepID=UPI00321C172B
MKKYYRRITVRLSWIFLLMVGLIQVAVGQESVQIPAKVEVLNTLKEQHPRLISVERMEQIKQVIQENKLAKEIWISNLKFVDELMDEKPVIYEKPDGRRLLSVSREALERIRSLALSYLILDDKKYAERAWQELEAVASFNDWNPSHFLDCAEMTHAVAIGYDWLYDFWNAEQRKILEDAILQKGLRPALEVYSTEEGWHTGNINWNQVCNGGISIGALAIAEHIPDVASKILSTAIESVLLPMKDYEPDGGGYEGPTYWDYGSRYNVLFLDALDNSLGTDFGLSSMEGFRRSGDFQIHLSGTDLWCFNFSDSDLKRMSTAQHFWMGKKYDEQRYSGFRYMALKSGVEGNLMDLLWFDDRFKDFDLKSMPLDKHFRVAEIITMRDSWDNGKGFAIAMKGGSSTRVHSHMDLGSFILEYDGVRWFTDFGKDAQTYQRHVNKAGRWDFYRTRAEGHNTLVVNPEFRGSQKRTANGIAEFIKFESGKKSATAVLDVSKSYYNDVLFKRTFTLNRGIEFRITDEIECKEPSELFLFYHTEAEIELTRNNRQAILKQDGKSIVVDLVKPLEAQFKVLPAAPMPESPILPFQEKNEGTKKLSIHFEDVEDIDLEITIKKSNDN